MFMPMEGAAQPPRRARATEPPSKWDYAKTFYYDPVKWNFVKSVAFFGLAVYMIRDFAANDLMPME